MCGSRNRFAGASRGSDSSENRCYPRRACGHARRMLPAKRATTPGVGGPATAMPTSRQATSACEVSRILCAGGAAPHVTSLHAASGNPSHKQKRRCVGSCLGGWRALPNQLYRRTASCPASRAQNACNGSDIFPQRFWLRAARRLWQGGPTGRLVPVSSTRPLRKLDHVASWLQMEPRETSHRPRLSLEVLFPR